MVETIDHPGKSNQSSCIYSLPGPNIDVQVLPLLHDVGRATACRHRASPPPCLPLAALLVFCHPLLRWIQLGRTFLQPFFSSLEAPDISVNPNLSILVLFQLTEPPVNLTASSTSNHNFRRLDLLCSRGSTYNSIFRFRFLLVHASVLSAVSTYYTLGLQPALFLSTPSSRSEVQSDVSPLTEPIPTACQSPPLWLHHSSLPNEVNPLLLLGWWAIT
ncbi:hypothetical protein Bca101_031190 [Brassica carinata]